MRIAIAVAAFAGALTALPQAQAVKGGFAAAWGDLYAPTVEAPQLLASVEERTPPPIGDMTARVRHWNEIAIDASGLDHTPEGVGGPHVFGEQLGPGRSARAMAIVHVAIFEVINSVEGGYRSYLGLPRAPQGTSLDAAIAQASHDTLAAMFPSQRAAFRAELTKELALVTDGPARVKGILLGKVAALAILAKKRNDGSNHEEPVVNVDHITSDLPGRWRQDPISLIPLALGAKWGEVKPFVLTSGRQFRAPTPPAISSAAYATAFDEVKRLGGDGKPSGTPTERTEDQTHIGIFWAYDGTPSLCAPPRLYNQIAVQIADQMGTTGIEFARLLALVNVAMADAGIAIWESKYFYDYWRPVTGIREADPGTGPTGLGDSNDATVGDVTFSPLGAPASNAVNPDAPNFTPPFPAYPSGHAGFGGALFQTLRRFYGRDDIAFEFISDEFNGVTRDNEGNVRPLLPRNFDTLSQAEEENGQSRIYLGIHWSFDKTEGIRQGRRVADYVFNRLYRPTS
jgi:membrane-associated phospholipid phosphatase